MWDAFVYTVALVGTGVFALVLPGWLSWFFAGLCAAVFVGMVVNASLGRRLRASARTKAR
jgi:hypothetical protein